MRSFDVRMKGNNKDSENMNVVKQERGRSRDDQAVNDCLSLCGEVSILACWGLQRSAVTYYLLGSPVIIARLHE